MGIKGDKHSTKGAQFTEDLVPRLASLGAVTSRKMFGGHGLFHEGKMFGLVSSDAELFFKVDDSNRAAFEKAGAPQHGKMPYFRVPAAVLADDELLDWASSAVAVAHS